MGSVTNTITIIGVTDNANEFAVGQTALSKLSAIVNGLVGAIPAIPNIIATIEGVQPIATIAAESVALPLSIVKLTVDLTTPTDNIARLGDVASVVGNLIALGGGIAGFIPGGQVLSPFITVAGNALTLLGAATDYSDITKSGLGIYNSAINAYNQVTGSSQPTTEQAFVLPQLDTAGQIAGASLAIPTSTTSDQNSISYSFSDGTTVRIPGNQLVQTNTNTSIGDYTISIPTNTGSAMFNNNSAFGTSSMTYTTGSNTIQENSTQATNADGSVSATVITSLNGAQTSSVAETFNGGLTQATVSGTALIQGSGASINLQDGSTVIVNGVNNQVTGGDGTNVTLNGQAATARLGDLSSLIDNTNGGNDTIGSNSTAAINGNNTVLTTGNNCGTAAGCVGDTINTANSTVSVDSTDSTVTVNGGGNTITGTNGSQITLQNTGSGSDTVTGNDLNVVADQGVNANVSGTGLTVNETGAGTSVGVFNTGTSADTVILTGNNEITNLQTNQSDPTDGSVAVTMDGTGDYAGLLGGSGYTVTGSNGSSNDEIATWDGTSFSASGNSDQIYTGSGETINLQGSGNSLSAGSNVVLTDNGTYDIDSVGSNSSSYINNSNDMLTEGTGSYAVLAGGSDTGTATGTGNFNLLGTNETATVADGGYIGVVAGSGDTANVNDGTVRTLDGVGVTISGSGDQVYGGANSNYVVSGNSDRITEGTSSFTSLDGSGNSGTATGTGGFNLSGYNDSATVADGAYVGIIGGSTGALVYDNNGHIVTNDDVGVTISGFGDQIDGGAYSNYVVSGSGDKITEGTGSFTSLDGSSNSGTATGSAGFNINGADDTTTVANGGYVGVISGSTGATIYDNSGTVQTQADVNLTVVGSGDTINTDSNAGGAVLGSGDTLNENGANDGFNIQTAGGAADTVNFNSTNDYAGLIGGSGYVVSGNNGTIATTQNTDFLVVGSSDTVDLAAGDGANILGSSDTANLFGTGDALGVYGGGNNTVVAGDASNVVWVGGDSTSNNDTIFATNDSNLQVTPGGSVTIVGNGDTVIGQGTGDIIGFNGVGETAFANYGTVNLNDNGDSVTVVGNGDTANAGSTIYDDFTLAQSNSDFDSVNANGAVVTLDPNGQANVYGSNDAIGLTADDVVGAYGGTNTINTGSGDFVVIGDTNGGYDTVNGSGDAAGGSTDKGLDGTGIYLNTNAEVNVGGSNNTIGLATDDDLGAYGGGNTIITSSDDLAVIGNTNGSFDTVYGTNDAAGGSTNGGAQGTGIYLNSNSEANIDGSNNTVGLGTGDVVGVYGGSNTIDTGSDNFVAIGNTGGSTDTVNGSADESGGSIDNGAYGTGVSLNSNTKANFSGSNDTIYLNNNDSINASDNFVDFGTSGDIVTGNYDQLYGSYDKFSVDGTGDGLHGTHDTYDLSGSDDTGFGSTGSDDTNEGSVNTDEYGGYGYGGYGFVGSGLRTSPGIETIAAYDQSQGYNTAADVAAGAFAQAEQSAAGDLATSAQTLSADPSGPKWAATTVSWDFVPGPTTGASPFSGAIGQPEQAVIEQAMQTWADASGLTFQEVSDPANADLSIGWGNFDTATSGIIGYTSTNGSAGLLQAGGVVRLEDPGETALTTNSAGDLTYSGTDATLYQVALHEIGHALGLGDNSDPNSVMYYSLGANNTTLDATDYAAIHQLYGAPANAANSSLDPDQPGLDISGLAATATPLTMDVTPQKQLVNA